MSDQKPSIDRIATPLTINQPVLQSPPSPAGADPGSVEEPFDPEEADRLLDLPIPDDDEDQ